MYTFGQEYIDVLIKQFNPEEVILFNSLNKEWDQTTIL